MGPIHLRNRHFVGAGSIFSHFWYGNLKILFVKTCLHLYPQAHWASVLVPGACSWIFFGCVWCVLSFFRWVFRANPLNGRFSEPKKNSCGLNFGSTKNPKSALRSEKSGVYFDHNRIWLETDVDGLYANYRHRRHNASSFLANFWGVCERNLMIFLAFIMFSSAPDAMGLVRKLSDLYLFWENVFCGVFRGFSWFQAFLCLIWALNSHQTMARPPGLYIYDKKYIRTKFWQPSGAFFINL